ncbi:MAG: hypothetical protein HOB51_08045 [Thaumarchaeota archaeon]|nr:hypothetical protein [Nitrososphaerota archaeon]
MSQEEIVVPKGWIFKRFGDIVNIKHGHQFRSNDFVDTDGYKILKIGQLKQNNILDLSHCDIVSKDRFDEFKEFIVKKDDILMALTGATLGKTITVNEDIGIVFQNYRVGKFVLKNKDISPEFLFYLLKSSFLMKQVFRKINQAAIGNIGKEDFENTFILFPKDKTVQKQIVQKLEDILGQLEVKKKEILSLVKQNKGRIDVFEKNWMSYVIDREIENHPQRKEWKLKELNQLNNIISGNAFKSTEFTKSGIPVITISNVGHGLFIDKSEKFLPIEFEKKYSQYLVKSNYILLALTRPFTDNNRLKVCKTSNLKNSLLNQRVAMIVPSDNIDVNFLLNAMQTTSFKKQTTENLSTSLQPNLSSTKLPLMTIPNPPLSTQKEIVKNIKSAEEKFQSQKKQFENIKNNYESKIKYINHIQSSVLDSAFSGKLVQ